ncbi:hypothetical protein DL240_05460 [Lujinxingia litoralis]|uniref:Uncharacterized protein n=1 Tax=Lujinxingia litoralis TaxID=2211119 RepID=A0A328C9J3_9DELT|nr:hypothetical protein [Lujinxingia litoralis]RAL23608.1 hypothetical protein DL240_05460 [Lujinxingia litoralis]
MAQTTPPAETSPDARKQRVETVARQARRAGYVLFFGTAVVLFVPILIGVIQGLNHDTIRDPFTGQLVDAEAMDRDCREDASALLLDAGRHGRTSAWDAQLRHWQARCEGAEPVAASMLLEAGRQLAGSSRPDESTPDER